MKHRRLVRGQIFSLSTSCCSLSWSSLSVYSRFCLQQVDLRRWLSGPVDFSSDLVKYWTFFSRLTGMPKEKYDPPDPRRCYTIMPAEEAANGKKSYWAELEISGQYIRLLSPPPLWRNRLLPLALMFLSVSPHAGRVRSLSSSLWTLTHLTALHINDNNLTRIPPDIAKLPNLVYLNLSSNKLRSLPAELGNMVSLRWDSDVVQLLRSARDRDRSDGGDVAAEIRAARVSKSFQYQPRFIIIRHICVVICCFCPRDSKVQVGSVPLHGQNVQSS